MTEEIFINRRDELMRAENDAYKAFLKKNQELLLFNQRMEEYFTSKYSDLRGKKVAIQYKNNSRKENIKGYYCRHQLDIFTGELEVVLDDWTWHNQKGNKYTAPPGGFPRWDKIISIDTID